MTNGYIHSLADHLWHRETALGRHPNRDCPEWGPWYSTLDEAKEKLSELNELKSSSWLVPLDAVILEVDKRGALEKLWLYPDQMHLKDDINRFKSCYGHIAVSEMKRIINERS